MVLSDRATSLFFEHFLGVHFAIQNVTVPLIRIYLLCRDTFAVALMWVFKSFQSLWHGSLLNSFIMSNVVLRPHFYMMQSKWSRCKEVKLDENIICNYMWVKLVIQRYEIKSVTYSRHSQRNLKSNLNKAQYSDYPTDSFWLNPSHSISSRKFDVIVFLED